MEEAFLEQTKGRDIDLIVCSDAEAILGIGDQGVGVCVILLYTDQAHANSSHFALGYRGEPPFYLNV